MRIMRVINANGTHFTVSDEPFDHLKHFFEMVGSLPIHEKPKFFPNSYKGNLIRKGLPRGKGRWKTG